MVVRYVARGSDPVAIQSMHVLMTTFRRNESHHEGIALTIKSQPH